MKICGVLAIILLFSSVSAGPLSYAICQTGCNALVVACYAAAGFTFGTGINEWVNWLKKVKWNYIT